jgi:preprotein translocase subunit SecF
MAVGVYSSIFLAPRVLVHLKSNETEVVLAERRAKARARKEADRYAAVPVFTDDMPESDDPDDERPSGARLSGQDEDDFEPTPRRTPSDEAMGRGRTVPTSERPVRPSSSSGRQQPTRQTRSKRTK